MILDSFRQDVRVGLRVLFKDKIFCFLAVLVLGLGIGGATTQFTIVNAIVLRGFSFPHPEQLMSVGLIDPKASDQNNNFGLGNIPTAQVLVILSGRNIAETEIVVLIAGLGIDEANAH